MSELLLVRLDGKRVYENDEFATEQFKHCTNMKNRLKEIHGEIISIMRKTFEVYSAFVHDIMIWALKV